MQLQELQPAPGSRKRRKRVGRGMGSGYGKTAGRGHKGQLSRSGGGKEIGFEGGQTPLARRIPKLPGFKNRNRIEYIPVNISRLEQKFDDGDTVDLDTLVEKGIIKNNKQHIKVLGEGELTKKLAVKVNKVSKAAQEKIEAAGGSVETLC